MSFSHSKGDGIISGSRKRLVNFFQQRSFSNKNNIPYKFSGKKAHLFLMTLSVFWLVEYKNEDQSSKPHTHIKTITIKPGTIVHKYDSSTAGQRQWDCKSSLASKSRKNIRLLVEWETLSQGKTVEINRGRGLMSMCVHRHKSSYLICMSAPP